MLHRNAPLPVSISQPLRPSLSRPSCLRCFGVASQKSQPFASPAATAKKDLGAIVARNSAALLVATSLLVGTPSLVPPARAESAAETRRAAAEQRKALLSQAREKALKNAAEISPSPTEGASEQSQESSSSQSLPEVGNSFGFKNDIQKEQAEESASRMQTQDLAPSPAAPVDEPRKPSPKAAAPKSEPSKAVEADRSPASVFQATKQGAEDAKQKAQEATNEAARSVPKPAAPKAPEPASNFNFSSQPKAQVQGESQVKPKPKAAVQGEAPKSVTAMKSDLKKQEVSKGKKQKRKGPLPMTVVQLLILALYGGLGYAVAVKDAEVRSVLRTAGSFIGQGYTKAVDSLPKQLKTKT